MIAESLFKTLQAVIGGLFLAVLSGIAIGWVVVWMLKLRDPAPQKEVNSMSEIPEEAKCYILFDGLGRLVEIDRMRYDEREDCPLVVQYRDYAALSSSHREARELLAEAARLMKLEHCTNPNCARCAFVARITKYLESHP